MQPLHLPPPHQGQGAKGTYQSEHILSCGSVLGTFIMKSFQFCPPSSGNDEHAGGDSQGVATRQG